MGLRWWKKLVRECCEVASELQYYKVNLQNLVFLFVLLPGFQFAQTSALGDKYTRHV